MFHTVPHLFKPVAELDQIAPLHPGEVLREDVLPHYKLKPADLALRLGVATEVVEDLLHERRRVDERIAAGLAEVFALSEQYWCAIQLQYDLWHAALVSDAASKPDQDGRGANPT